MPEAIAAEHVRLFIALMIPEEVKTEMERVQVELGRGLAAGGLRSGRHHAGERQARVLPRSADSR